MPISVPILILISVHVESVYRNKKPIAKTTDSTPSIGFELELHHIRIAIGPILAFFDDIEIGKVYYTSTDSTVSVLYLLLK